MINNLLLYWAIFGWIIGWATLLYNGVPRRRVAFIIISGPLFALFIGIWALLNLLWRWLNDK